MRLPHSLDGVIGELREVDDIALTTGSSTASACGTSTAKRTACSLAVAG